MNQLQVLIAGYLYVVVFCGNKVMLSPSFKVTPKWSSFWPPYSRMVGVQTAHYQSYYIDEIKLLVFFSVLSILSIVLKDKLPSLWGEGEQLKEYVFCVAVLSFLLVFLFSLCIRT